MRQQRGPRGFTLVELLVVISIIGILAAMLLPAVQAARESGRRTQCRNNIKQLASACEQHLTAHGHFPTAGWGWKWAGDPDRGFSKKQPGGWLYNILPYIEESSLHSLGRGQSDANRKIEAGKRSANAVSVYYCPSRRRADVYPIDDSFVNMTPTADRLAGRNDYVASAGDLPTDGSHPGPGDMSFYTKTDAQVDAYYSGPQPNAIKQTGLMFARSEVRAAHIRDGMSKTYLLGEKYIQDSRYEDSSDAGNDQSWESGYDRDSVRWSNTGGDYQPQSDYIAGNTVRFGSAHTSAFHMAFADGSVHAIAYEIEPRIHAALANRKNLGAVGDTSVQDLQRVSEYILD